MFLQLKTYTIFLLLIMISKLTYSQEAPKTIFADTLNHVGWFIGPVYQSSFFFNDPFKNRHAIKIGGKAGVVINRKFILGLEGFGKPGRLRYEGDYPILDDDENEVHPLQPLAVGYGAGGVIIGYIFESNKPIHVRFPIFIGGGTANEYEIELDGDKGTTINSPGFFMVRFGAVIELNLAKYNRLNIGFNYQFVNTRYFEQITSNGLNGFSVTTAFLFGKY